jgi:hypothetical protein
MSSIVSERDLVDIQAAVVAVRRLPPHAALAREAGRLRRDEIDGSLVLDGGPLTRTELDALADRGLAMGGHPLGAYIEARDLSVAAGWVAEQRPIAVADPRPLITVEDVRRLHTLATAGTPDSRPGVWRLRVEPAAGGIVAPPPWLVAKETTALVDRFRRRPPPGEIPATLAALLARFARIRPFVAANGRTGRLAAALLARRLDVVPPAIARGDAPAYHAALRAAIGGDHAALTAMLEASLLRGCRRLIAAAGTAPLTPLRDLAGRHYAALIKAAKRGRLATIERDGRVYSTAAWIAAYRSATNRRAARAPDYDAPV